MHQILHFKDAVGKQCLFWRISSIATTFSISWAKLTQTWAPRLSLHVLSIICLVNFRVQNTFFVFLMQIIVMQLVKMKTFLLSYINAVIYLFYRLCNNMSIFLSRVDNIILDAVSTLKEPNGSRKSVIASYIEVIMFKPHLGMLLH